MINTNNVQIEEEAYLEELRRKYANESTTARKMNLQSNFGLVIVFLIVIIVIIYVIFNFGESPHQIHHRV
jgi:hypothetical protein